MNPINPGGQMPLACVSYHMLSASYTARRSQLLARLSGVEQVQGVYDPDWTDLYAELDADIIRDRR